MMAMLRAFVLMLTIVCVIGCAENSSAPIRFGLNTNIVTLDPRYATDAVSSRLCRLIYQSLVEFNESFQPVPGIAKWQQLSSLRYVFEIEAKHVFHNGKRLTALDVAATYHSVLDKEQASPHRTSGGR